MSAAKGGFSIMLTTADKGGGVMQMLTLAYKNAKGGVRQMLTLTNKEGKGSGY